jgi:8-oxo-dGTP pyrophosphatase MutT (NUDIX family)
MANSMGIPESFFYNKQPNLSFTLPLSREDYLAHVAPSHINKVVVGAAILAPREDPYSYQPAVLLLQRSRFKLYYPEYYEIPSGRVGANETIEQALARVVTERTGLADSRVFAQLEGFTHSPLKKMTIPSVGPVEMRENSEVGDTIQLNFAVLAGSWQVTWDERKHSQGEWADENRRVRSFLIRKYFNTLGTSLAPLRFGAFFLF